MEAGESLQTKQLQAPPVIGEIVAIHVFVVG
jgi:hypothetical protein